MVLCSRFLVAPVFLLGAIAALAQQSAPIVQPGAPGQPGKFLNEKTVWTPAKAPFDADVEFMQGMIMHHSQAVDMVALLHWWRSTIASILLETRGRKLLECQ